MVTQSVNRSWLVVIGGIISVFIAVMDIQITNVAIGPIQTSLGSPTERASWFSSVYLLAEIVALPLAGLFLQHLGKRYFAIVFIGLFLLGSVLCAMATSFSGLVIARAFQGFAGGALMALSYVLIIQHLEIAQRARAITLYGALIALAPVIGPALAGYLIEIFNWRAIFLINLPIGGLALALLLVGLNGADTQKNDPPKRTPLDRFGILTVVPGLVALQFVLEEGYDYGWFASPVIVILSMAAIILLVCFVLIEFRVAAPLINLRLLTNPGLLMACASSLLVGAAMYGGFFLIPLYLIEARSLSPAEIAPYFLWMCVGSLALVPIITRLVQRFSAPLLIACGFVLFALSVMLWSLVAAGAALTVAVVAQLIRGFASP
ncbi:MAG: DHA2 family efflux MFS transporter permease subunit, partial [Litoreibacter sp.]